MSAANQSECLNCGASDNDRPLVSVRFAGKDFGFCSTCLPILIHKPETIQDKLAKLAAS